MYQPYPSGGQAPQPLPPLSPPRSVLTAVKLMYAGAALSAISFILGFVTIGSIRSLVLKAARQAHRHLTNSQITTQETFIVASAVVLGVLGVVLWIWMARANGKGRSWARIVASVLFGLDTVSLLLSLARPHFGYTLILGALIWLAGLGAIVLLWQRDSTEYFQASSQRPRYT